MPDLNLKATYGTDLDPAVVVFHFAGAQSLQQPFDGTDLSFPADLTFSLWLNTSQTNAVIFTYGPAGGGTGSRLTVMNPADLEVTFDSSTTGGTGVSFSDNQWHHLCVTLSRSGRSHYRVQIYKDGRLAYQSIGVLAFASGAGLAPAGQMILGNSASGPGAFLNGFAGNFQLWRGVRSNLDIATDMQRRLPDNTPNLLLNWYLESLTTEGPNTVDSFTPSSQTSAPLRFRNHQSGVTGYVMAQWTMTPGTNYVFQMVAEDGRWSVEINSAVSPLAVPGVLLGRKYKARVGEVTGSTINWSNPVELTPLNLGQPVVAMTWPEAGQLTGSWQQLDQSEQYQVALYKNAETTPADAPVVQPATTSPALNSKINDTNSWRMIVRGLSQNSDGPGNDAGSVAAPDMTLIYARDYEDPTKNTFSVSWLPITPAPAFFYLSLSKVGEQQPFLQTHWTGDTISPHVVPYTAAPFNPNDQISGQLRLVTASALGQWDTETITVLDLGGAPILNPLQVVPTDTVRASWTFDAGQLTNVNYQVQLYSDPANPLVNLFPVNATTADLSYAGQPVGTTLFVRVRAQSNGNFGRWSQLQTFRVGSNLAQPKINDVCVNTNLSITAAWGSVTGADTYFLTLRKPSDPSFKKELANVTGTRVDWSQSDTGLQAQTQYTLTVEARATGQQPSPESAPFAFDSGKQCSGTNPHPVIDPINQASGQYIYSHADIAVNAVLPLQFITYYTSPLPDDNANVKLKPLGPHWSHYYNIFIEKTPDNSKAVVQWRDGSSSSYSVPVSLTGQYPRLGTPNGDQLFGNDDLTYRLTLKDQTVYNFAANGILQSIVARDGNRQDLTYTNGQLTRITDAGSGRFLSLTYLQSGQIETVADNSGRSIRYDYFPTTFDLKSVTDVQQHAREFTYQGNSLLKTLKDENGTVVITNDYWPDQRVKSQTDALQQTTNFSYEISQDSNGFQFIKTTMTDPMGYVSIYFCNVVTQGVMSESHALTLTPGGAVRMIAREFDGLNNLSRETVYEGPPIPLPLTAPLPGNITQYTYDGNANVLTITGPRATDPVGNLGTFVYDANNNLTSFTDLLGNTTIQHFENNLLKFIQRPLNFKQVFDYQNFGTSRNRLHLITDYPGNSNVANPIGNITTMAYDNQGQIASVVDPLGNTVAFGYDTNNRGQLTSIEIKDKAGTWLQKDNIEPYPLTGWTHHDRILYPSQPEQDAYDASYIYDNLGIVTSITNALNAETKLEYYDNGPLKLITYPAKAGATPDKTTIQYDADNNLSQIIYSPASPHVANSYTFDPLKRITSFIDGNSQPTSYAYEMMGISLGASPPFPTQKTTTFPKLPDEPESYQTRETFDPLGRLVKVTEVTLVSQQPSAPFTSIAYGVIPDPDNPGTNQLQVVVTLPKADPQDPQPFQVIVNYDALGRLKSRTDESGKLWTISYTPTTDTSTSPQTTRQVVVGVDPLTNQRIVKLDALDRIVTREIPASGSTTPLQKADYEYDALNRLTKVTEQAPSGPDPLVTLYTYLYDVATKQLRVTVTPYNGPSSFYGYNGMDQLVQYTDSLTSPVNPITILLGYTPRGQLETYQNGRQQVLTYGYDAAGRFTTLTLPGGTPNDVITQTLDGNGNRIATLRGATTQITRTFDVLNRLTSRTRNTFNETVAYTYWPSDRLRKLIYPGISTPVQYEYDGLQRLKLVTDWQQHETRYTYYPTGQLKTSTLPGGVSTNYNVDNAGRFTGFETKAPSNIGEILLARAAYTLNAAGTPTAVNQVLPIAPSLPVGEQPMTYVSDRLDTLKGQPVGYDGDGNMTTIPGVNGTLTHNSLNQLTSVGTTQFAYDEDGLRERVTLGNSSTRYVQDAADYISPLVNQGDPQRAIQFATLTPSLEGPFELTPWIGLEETPQSTDAALDRVLVSLDSQNTVQAKYVYGHGLISRESGTDPSDYKLYVFDGQGTTLALFAPALSSPGNPGVISDRYAYAPYGNSATHYGTTANPFLYQGRDGVMDDGLGLLFMRARYYATPALRFSEKDFLFGEKQVPQSLNRYGFVRGNPLQRIDPLGLSPWDTVLIVAGSLLGAGLLGFGIYKAYQAYQFYKIAQAKRLVDGVELEPLVPSPRGGSPSGSPSSSSGARQRRPSSAQYASLGSSAEGESLLSGSSSEMEMQTIRSNVPEAMQLEEGGGNLASGGRAPSSFSTQQGSYFNQIYRRFLKTSVD